MGNMSTMTAQRWCARLLSIAYYFVVVPLLYDLFMNGARWRAALLFPFILLGVAGVQIGYKEDDRWVRIWFWINLIFIATLTCLAFYYPPFAGWVSLSINETWVLFACMAVTILALPLNHFIPHATMRPFDEEEDLEKDLPPVPNQNPAK
jgi:hypothetical protein